MKRNEKEKKDFTEAVDGIQTFLWIAFVIIATFIVMFA